MGARVLTFRAIAALAVSVALSACASLNYIHDPQGGVVSRDVLPDLFKSLRCELVTYYQATYRRQDLYKRYHRSNPEYAAANYSYFDLDDNLYGMFYLDLKVADSLSLPGSSTAIDKKTTLSPTSSRTWHFGPTGGVTDTYELNWSFAIKQNANFDNREGDIAALPSGDYPGSLQCYTSIPPDLDALAAGAVPGVEQFKRIYVNGTKPLAYWLLENGALMAGVTVASKDDVTRPNIDANAIFSGQMVYTFIVSVSGGLDVKFSLLTSVWNPLAGDVSGGIQQTNTLVFYINGVKSAVASNAKGGNSLIFRQPAPPTQVVIAGQGKPVVVIPVPGKTKEGTSGGVAEPKFATPPSLPAQQLPEYVPPPRRGPTAPARDRGYFINPSVSLPTVP